MQKKCMYASLLTYRETQQLTNTCLETILLCYLVIIILTLWA